MLNTQKYTCAQTITYKLNIVFEYKVSKPKKKLNLFYLYSMLKMTGAGYLVYFVNNLKRIKE